MSTERIHSEPAPWGESPPPAEVILQLGRKQKMREVGWLVMGAALRLDGWKCNEVTSIE